MNSETEAGSQFDLRSVLANATLWGVTFFLCVSPLFAIAKGPEIYLLKRWDAYGIWWVIALSVASNLVLRMAIRRFGSVRVERMSVWLWAISTGLHYAPFLLALGALTGGVSERLGLSALYLKNIGWLLYSPLAAFITAGLTVPERFRI